MFSTEFTLPNMLATGLFVLAVISGYQYRKTWKSEGPVWKAWLFGALAGICLLLVALIPLRGG